VVGHINVGTMCNGKERANAILHGPEGEEIYLRLVRYAEMLARMRGWRTGATLPASETPQSLVSSVLIKLLAPDGDRTWDEAREPSLLNALKGMVRSEIGHLYEKLEENLLEPISIPLPGGEERTGDSFPSTDLHPEALNPEQQLLRSERANLEFAAMTLVLKQVEGNSDLELVVLALCDTDKPSEIAAMTGLSIKRVYSARRELDRIVRKITLTRVIRAARDEGKP
jgi:hypothetical protein